MYIRALKIKNKKVYFRKLTYKYLICKVFLKAFGKKKINAMENEKTQVKSSSTRHKYNKLGVQKKKNLRNSTTNRLNIMKRTTGEQRRQTNNGQCL